MQLKDINHQTNANRTVLKYICKDGSVIKESYIFYSLSEAKKKFKAKYKNLI